jgi:hypothetical protein
VAYLQAGPLPWHMPGESEKNNGTTDRQLSNQDKCLDTEQNNDLLIIIKIIINGHFLSTETKRVWRKIRID